MGLLERLALSGPWGVQMESSTAEKDDLGEERSEDLVSRIRGHIEQAERKESGGPWDASSHREIADELFVRLWKRHCSRAKAIARSVFGSDRGLVEDVDVEVARQLHRVIVQPGGTLRGLDENFRNAFKTICVDAVRKVGRDSRGRDGNAVPHYIREDSEAQLQKTRMERVVSAETPTKDRRDRDVPPVETGISDIDSEEDFRTVLGHVAYRALIGRLPERQRTVIEMVSQQKTFKQIAADLQIHPDTVSSDFDKAIQFFENNLATQLRRDR